MRATLRHNDLFRYGPECQAEPLASGIKQVRLGSFEHAVQFKSWFEHGAELVVPANTLTRMSYILDGFFEISIAGQTQILGPSGSFVVPIGADCAIRCLEDGILLSTQSAQLSGDHRTAPNKQELSSSTASKRFDRGDDPINDFRLN